MYGSSHKSPNLIPTTLDIIKSANTSGTWNGNKYIANGVTFTVNDDLTISCSGSATTATAFIIYPSTGATFLQSGTTYKIVGCPNNGGDNKYKLDFDNNTKIDNGAGTSFTSITTDNRVRIVVYSNYGNGLVFKPMITTDTSLTYADYEPYGLIMSKGEVESGNKNKIDDSKKFYDGSNAFIGVTSRSTIHIPKGSYVFSAKTTSTSPATKINVTTESVHKETVVTMGANPVSTLVLTEDADLYVFVTNVSSASAVESVMMEVGTTPTDYIPYVSSSISAYDTIGNYLLSVGSDVKDELCVNADGTGIRTPKCGYIDMGTLTWDYNSDAKVFYAYVNGKQGGRTNMLTADYKTVNKAYADLLDKEISGTSSTGINIRDDAFSDKDAFKTAMSGQYLIYELATVTPQTLTASQVQSLLALQTFKAHTDIVADCTVDLSYYKDNANGQSVADVDARLNDVVGEVTLVDVTNDFVSANSNITIDNTSKVYKQGNRIFGRIKFTNANDSFSVGGDVISMNTKYRALMNFIPCTIYKADGADMSLITTGSLATYYDAFKYYGSARLTSGTYVVIIDYLV